MKVTGIKASTGERKHVAIGVGFRRKKGSMGVGSHKNGPILV